LLNSLQEKEPIKRGNAARSLGELCVHWPDDSCDRVGELLFKFIINEPEAVAQQGAFDGFKAFWQQGIPLLIKVLQDDDEQLRQGAANVLKLITEQDFGQDADRWQQWWGANQATL